MRKKAIDKEKLKIIAILAAILIVASAVITLFIILERSLSQEHLKNEEQDTHQTIVVTNIDILYSAFSDYTIDNILNSVKLAVKENSSVKNGVLLSEYTTTASDATNDKLYKIIEGELGAVSIVDGKVDYIEDEWGMWNVFKLKTKDGRVFKVMVGIGAHNRENDFGYTPITVTKMD